MNLFKTKSLPTDAEKLLALSKKGGLLEIVSKLLTVCKSINTMLTATAATMIVFGLTENYLLSTLIFGVALIVAHIFHNAIVELVQQGEWSHYAAVVVMFVFAAYLDSNASFKLAQSTVTYKAAKTDISPNRSLFLSRTDAAQKVYTDAVNSTSAIDAQMDAVRQKWQAVKEQNAWTAAMLAKELKPLTAKKTAVLEQAAQKRDNRISDADNSYQKQEARVNGINDTEQNKQEASEAFAATGARFISTLLLLIVIFCAYKEKCLNKECGVIITYTAKESGEIDGFDAIGYSVSLLFNNILISIGNLLHPKETLVFEGENKKQPKQNNFVSENSQNKVQNTKTDEPAQTSNAHEIVENTPVLVVPPPTPTPKQSQNIVEHQNAAVSENNSVLASTENNENKMPQIMYSGKEYTYSTMRSNLRTYYMRAIDSDATEAVRAANMQRFNNILKATQEAGYTVKKAQGEKGYFFVLYYNSKKL